MNRFRYYIADLTMGKMVGTDDTDLARRVAGSEDYFVVDTFENQWLQADGDSVVVDELKSSIPPDEGTVEQPQQELHIINMGAEQVKAVDDTAGLEPSNG